VKISAGNEEFARFTYFRTLRLPLIQERHPNNDLESKGGSVKKAALTITSVVGAATLIWAGFVFLSALPDMRRYIRISSM
jgi:hypothetical protein